jgi:WD40 repeat protein
MRLWQAHERAVVSVAFAPAGDCLATAADEEPGVRVWDVAAGGERERTAKVAVAVEDESLAAGDHVPQLDRPGSAGGKRRAVG